MRIAAPRMFVAVAAWIAAVGCSSDEIAGQIRPNVVIIVLDTLRADRSSSYGYARPTTPNLDALALEGVLFTNMVSNATWTLPAHASLFTGRLPAEHGATQENLALSETLPTLAELFTAAGYETFGASGNPIVGPLNGLSRGFGDFAETYRQPDEAVPGAPHKNQTAFERFLDVHQTRRDGPPFFAFLNYIEAHLPYAPPEPHRSRMLRRANRGAATQGADRARMREHYQTEGGLPPRTFSALSDLYDGEVAGVDALLGELVAMLRARDLLDDSIVVVTSDHGEHLGEDGHLGHVFSIHNVLLEIPLVVRLPGARDAGTRREDLAQLVDLFPTVLAQCGIAPPRDLPGRDLFGPRAAAETTRTAISEYYFPHQVLSALGFDAASAVDSHLRVYRRRLRAAQDLDHKLVVRSDGTHDLYDRRRNEAEPLDLMADPSLQDRIAALQSALPDADDSHGPAGGADYRSRTRDEELLEQLRALGYAR